MTLNSSAMSLSPKGQTIPVVISSCRNSNTYCPDMGQRDRAGQLIPVRKVIPRDNNIIQARSLPIITNYNMRSFLPKIDNFCKDVSERESDICFITEIWQTKESKSHQFKLEEMLHMKGIQYISTPRPTGQRGGGAAIAVSLSKFRITKINVCIPNSVEAVWGILKPVQPSGPITEIICCCFYSRPQAKKNMKLIDHLTVNFQSLLTSHPRAGVILSGDRNLIDIPLLLSIDPSFRQIVKLPTRGPKILDVIVTNLASFYNDPQILPAIKPDNPCKGVPSDHSGVIATPNRAAGKPPIRQKETKQIRPISESGLQLFGQYFVKQSWEFLDNFENPTEMAENFESVISAYTDNFFPPKTIFVTPYDKPYFTEELRKMKCQRQRYYRTNGKN